MSDMKKSNNKITPFQKGLADFLKDGIGGDIKSISIIGSYLINKRLRPGSDIDTVIVVDDLDSTKVNFGDKIFYKNTIIEDSQGKRQELNVKFNNIPIDITVLDPNTINPPNNPLTDYYENLLGLCESGHTIYGSSLREVIKLDERVAHYDTIRENRLKLVEEKTNLTKRKILEQGRDDLYIIYELQRYIFIRECISRKIFNRLSMKHPEQSIPDFEDVFTHELGECGLSIKISRKYK